MINGVNVSRRVSQQTVRTDPKSFKVGDVTAPWNVGLPVFSLKAARDMTITDITIDCGEVISASGAPVCLEVWRDGKYSGDMVLTHGVTEFSNKQLQLKKLDEIELRLVAKGEHTEATAAVKNLWVLYCVA
jgi:hypothetical protein